MFRPRRSRPRPVLRRLRVLFLPVPSQALGLLLLAVVLGSALVSVPLVPASAEQGAWELERARQAETAVGATLSSSTQPLAQTSSRARIARASALDAAVVETVRAEGLPTPVSLVRLRNSLFTDVPDAVVRTQLMAKTGWEDQVEIVAGEVSGRGVVIPERLAERAGAGPGDSLIGRSELGGGSVTVLVTGVYAEPVAPLPDYWAAQSALFRPETDPATGEPVPAPPIALAPQDTVVATAAVAGQDLLLEWSLPLPPDATVDDARTAVDRFEALQTRMSDLDSPVSRVAVAEGFDRPTVRSELPDVLATVDRTVDLLRPPVRAVGIGGVAAALVLVGAWAAQRARRRDAELRALVARGLSPARGAGHATREALLPVLAGAATGGLAGRLLLRLLGPAPDLPAGAVPQALAVLGVGCVAALVVVAGVTAALVTRLDQLGRGPLTSALGRVPWIAVTAAVAVVTAVPVVTGSRDDGRLDALTLVLPLLVTAAVAGALTAALPRLAGRVAARLDRLSPAASLALRRVLAGRGAARLVVVTTALSTGLVLYAGALADSADRTIAAKAAVSPGADVVVPLVRRTTEPGPLPPGTTVVGTERGVTLVPGEVTADLLVVEPDEVVDVLRWDDALADRPPRELLAELSRYDGDRVPALLAGPVPDELAASPELTLGFFSYYSLPVQVVGRAAAFPGQTSRVPVLVADPDSVTAALQAADRDPLQVFDRQVWAPGEVAPLLASLTAAGYAYDDGGIATADAFPARPEVRAQAWSLAYLRAVALAAGLLGLLGVAMHALAQQRRRTVAALLLTRMGLSRRSARVATVLETGLLTGLGAVVAAAVALPVSALVVRLLDPAPTLLPGALSAVPWSSVAAVVVGLLVVPAGAALLVGRSTGRASAGEVLRDAP